MLELEGLGGTLLEVVVLLILHRKGRRELRGRGYWVRRLLWIGGRGGEGEHTTHPDDLNPPPRWT